MRRIALLIPQAELVGRERRERVSQLTWCDEGCFDLRRPVNSDVMALHSMIQMTRFAFLTIAVGLLCHSVAAQSKFIVWPKEPGHRIRPAGTPGGQANALAQFDNLEIEEILVEGKPVIIGQAFNASDDWLNDITIRVKNISQQKFATIQMTLILPEIKSGPDIPVCYGCAIDQRGKGLAPGDMAELKTQRSEQFYDWVKTSITEKAPLSAITIAQIRDTLAILSDGSSWLSECVKTANPLDACPHGNAP